MPSMHCTSRHVEGILVCPCNINECIGYYIMLLNHVDLMSNVDEGYEN